MNHSTTPTSGQARINYKRQQRAAFWAAEGERTVWHGPGEPVGGEHQARVVAWLRANRIDTTRVDGDSPITATRTRIRFTRIHRNQAGHAMLDGRGRLVTEQSTVPLRVHFVTPTEA